MRQFTRQLAGFSNFDRSPDRDGRAQPEAMMSPLALDKAVDKCGDGDLSA